MNDGSSDDPSPYVGNTGFLAIDAIDIWALLMLCCGGCLVHYRTREQHPWVLPTRCQRHHPTIHDNRVSPDIAVFPSESRINQPQSGTARFTEKMAVVRMAEILLGILICIEFTDLNDN